jgi:large subunit ribosomal protein L5
MIFRYQFRPPKYYRGPLHPYQPPPASDPSSREFTPGPFSFSRLEQTYQSTIAQDVMALTYMHLPPGKTEPAIGQRLRTWEGDSPYFPNRPLRAPKGGEVLRPVHRRITFRNIPQLERITVHSMSSEAGGGDSEYLHVMGMVIQNITNVRVTTHASKTNVQQWGLKKGKFASVTAELRGEDMYHFLSKVVDLVMPRIKDWRGVEGSSGDGTGNLSFGFESEVVALFPEVEVNYDM